MSHPVFWKKLSRNGFEKNLLRNFYEKISKTTFFRKNGFFTILWLGMGEK